MISKKLFMRFHQPLLARIRTGSGIKNCRRCGGKGVKRYKRGWAVLIFERKLRPCDACFESLFLASCRKDGIMGSNLEYADPYYNQEWDVPRADDLIEGQEDPVASPQIDTPATQLSPLESQEPQTVDLVARHLASPPLSNQLGPIVPFP